MKSEYHPGANVFEWMHPFERSLRFEASGAPLRLTIELRSKRRLGLRGRTVCYFTLQIEQACQSATFNLRANESGISLSPELWVTVTVVGLAPANEDPVQSVQDAPVVTISGPDDTENIASGPLSSPPNPHVAGGLSANRSTGSTHSPLNPAARGANDQLLSQALAKSNDAMRSQLSLDVRTPSIAESNPDVAGPTAEAAAQITWSGVSRIGAVMELVNVAADIHPLVKGVWSLLNVAYVLAKQQADLDTNVERLVHALDANCELAKDLAENQITGIAETIVGNILKEIMKGASVIKEYCVIRKSKASVFKFVGSPTASQVDACIETLELLRQDLSAHLAAGTQRDLQTLSSTMNARFDRIDGYFQTKEDEALLNQMPYAPEADRDLRSRERGCLPQTRVEIIDAIVDWAIGAELDTATSYIPGLKPDSRVLWLCGVAGSGKSSIAISVARALRSMDRLGALYGFERAFQTTLNPTNLFSTIARQRADRRADQKRHLLQRLQQMQPEIRATTDAGEQLARFLTSVPSEGALAPDDVVVIDAFDESGEPPARRAVILALSRHLSDANFLPGLRLIIASRYEPDVAESLDGLSASDRRMVSLVQMQDIETLHTERDIKVYVYHMLEGVTGLEAFQAAGELARLAVAAEHSFQWASTACLYIVQYDNDALRTPATRLEETLNTKGGLNPLYHSILDQHFGASIKSQAPGVRSLQVILGSLVCAFEPLSINTMAAFGTANMPKSDASSYRLIARRLSSIVTGTHDTSTPLIPLHTSFTDFLRDPEHSGDYAVASHDVHVLLGLACLTVMKRSLRFNICELETSFLPNDAVPDLAERIKQHIPDELSYACRFWPAHVAAALSSSSDEVKHLRGALGDLLGAKIFLLNWLEVTSLLRADALHALSPLSFLQTENRDLSDLITFTTYFAIPISTSVPHIYLSALAFAPSSSLIASIRVHCPNLVQSDSPLASWPQIRHSFSHETGINCVAFTPDGQRVVSGAESGEISVWDVYSGSSILPRMSASGAIKSIAISRDGSLLASGSNNGTFQLWDVRTLSAVGEPVEGHSDWVRSVMFSPDGRLLASGSDDKTICLWDLQSGLAVQRASATHDNSILSLAFSPDGELLALGSSDRAVRLWDVSTLSPVGEPLTGHTTWVSSVAFSPNGTLLVSASSDRTIRFWDMHTQSAIGEPLPAHDAYIYSVAFSTDGETLASCSEDKTVRLWDVESRSSLGEPLTGHTGFVNSVVFSPDGALLASGSADKTVHLWDARVVSLNPESPATQFKIQNFAAFSPDGRLVASGSDGNEIQLWDVHSVTAVGDPLKGHTNSIYCMAFSPDGHLLASGSNDQTIRLWDARTGSAVGEPLRGHSDSVWALAFSPDSKLLASASLDHTIWLWDTPARSACGNPLKGHSTYVISVAFSPDGLTLASGDAGGDVRLWDVRACSPIGEALERRAGCVRCVAFSPDGTLLASGSDDKSVCLWDVGTHSAVGDPLKGHAGYVKSLAFSRDGALMVSSSWSEDVVRVWDVRAPSEVGEPVALLRHDTEVSSIAFFLAAPILSSITSGGVARKWDLWSLPFVQTANVHGGSERRLAKNPSSSQLPDHPDLGLLSPDSLVNLDDGWVVGPRNELILWIPPAVRASLYDQREIERFGGPPHITLDFTDFVCGSEWAKCNSPPPSTSNS